MHSSSAGAMAWRSATPRKIDDVPAATTRNQIGDVCAPALKGVTLFIGKIMTLIDSDNSAERSRRMVQNLLDDGKVDAEPRHARRRRAP